MIEMNGILLFAKGGDLIPVACMKTAQMRTRHTPHPPKTTLYRVMSLFSI